MFVPGKVNLFLRVGGVRPVDGRHRIATLFLPLNRLGDDVEVAQGRPGTGIRLRAEGRVVTCLMEENLAYKAAVAFCRCFGTASDWEIVLITGYAVSTLMAYSSSIMSMSYSSPASPQPPRTKLIIRVPANNNAPNFFILIIPPFCCVP